MKKVILFVCLFPCLAYGQIIENFEQGKMIHWDQYPAGHWIADTSECISGTYSLHHSFDNQDAGTDQAGIMIDSLHPSDGDVRWSFLIRYGCDPSSTNNWSVFLMTDSDPGSVLTDGRSKGFAVGVNLSGYDDTLRLWKINGTVVSAIVNTGINWQTDIGTLNTARITVDRTIDGLWTVSVSLMTGEKLAEAQGSDSQLLPCEWLVLSYEYTSSRDRLLWLDDLSIDGTFYQDNSPPYITGCDAYDKFSVQLTLSDQPSGGFQAASNFMLSPGDFEPVSVVRVSGTVYDLVFESEFVNNLHYLLSVKELCSGNNVCTENMTVSFSYFRPVTGDIIITEIMADPEPAVSLPTAEYIEITNRTGTTFTISNWILSTGETDYPLPATTIRSHERIIICQARDTMDFLAFGRVMGLKQFPSLTDNGRLLLLYDDKRMLIHGVDYSSDWYNSELKSKGGWSLEMIDSDYQFYDKGNWTASASVRGGTPGSPNSVARKNPDTGFAGDLILFPVDSLNILTVSPEPLFLFAGLTDSILIGTDYPYEIVSSDPLFRTFLIKLNDPLVRGRIYQVVIKGLVRDFAGNMPAKNKFDISLSEPAVYGDILFNELLFNPLPGDPDYIELYNASGRTIDASRLEIVSVNDASADTSSVCFISDCHRCLLPGTYYAFTTDVSRIINRYFSSDPGSLFETSDLPSMPDDKGHLVLFSRELVKIDEVAYNQKMHSSLLSGSEGVALEKTSAGGRSEDPANWKSATETSGWGTPGAPNSVLSISPLEEDPVSLSSSRITPDDDGFEDRLNIRFNLDGNNNVLSATVFDETGSLIRKVAENIYAGHDAILTWDGTADDGSMVSTGIYIIFIRLFDESGKTRRWKKVCTVIRQ